ncbi:hypothetical protein ACWCQ1_45320 [Streptomyces sp. NPDC002144]
MALITDLLQSGRVREADAFAAWLDEQVAGTLGVSHPDALRIREMRAHVTALAGKTVVAVLMFRDVAEPWHYQGGAEQAEAAAARAETLWLQMCDLAPALSARTAMVRMRNQIPGERGQALTAALEHRTWLEAAAGAAGSAEIQDRALSWERPAQELRPTA